ncbi:GTPase effector domain, GED [Parachaetomium inaequale]|uniref:GTPase effector domain, GED n=1 Tax=Parachaetomium inaequale TaxID=2588326 RepID=A0AAN6P6R9_9PEZI|nr:GTPase effector domain, GED [Parachaetomium inaequale]
MDSEKGSSDLSTRDTEEANQSFQALVKSSVDGNYDSSFFSDANTSTGYEQRIRAVVQNLNEDFASNISLRGHYREVIDLDSETGHAPSSSRGLIHRTQGRELPGTFNPIVVVDLFHEQSRPWESIARRHVEKLLNPHQNGHPITYNHYFTETLHKVRESRRKDPEKILCRFLKVPSLTSVHSLYGNYDLRGLADALGRSSEPDMRRFAAGEAMDCLNAYYKVALKRFIDDMAVEVVETKLMSALDSILSPISVYQMPADEVAHIAGESEDTRAERDQLNKQLERFVGFRISGGKNGNDQDKANVRGDELELRPALIPSLATAFDGLNETSDKAIVAHDLVALAFGKTSCPLFD